MSLYASETTENLLSVQSKKTAHEIKNWFVHVITFESTW